MAERVFQSLAGEKQLQSLHIAGGEPFLRMDFLEKVMELVCSMGMPIHYVETNAFWCDDRAKTRERLARLRQAGLPAS